MMESWLYREMSLFLEDIYVYTEVFGDKAWQCIQPSFRLFDKRELCVCVCMRACLRSVKKELELV